MYFKVFFKYIRIGIQLILILLMRKYHLSAYTYIYYLNDMNDIFFV